MNPPGLKHKALVQCYPVLVDCLQQSPNDIAMQLRPSGILAQTNIAFLKNPQKDDRVKAETIVDIVILQAKNDPGMYDKFIEALKAAGDWTRAATTELKQTYTSLLSTQLVPQKEGDTSIKSDDSTVSLASPVTSQPQQASLSPEQSYSQIARNLYQERQTTCSTVAERMHIVDNRGELTKPCVAEQFPESEPSLERIADKLETAPAKVEDLVNSTCYEESPDEETIRMQVVSHNTEMAGGLSAFTAAVVPEETPVRNAVGSFSCGVEAVSQSAVSLDRPGQQVIGNGSFWLDEIPTQLLRESQNLRTIASQVQTARSNYVKQYQDVQHELNSTQAEKIKLQQRIKASEDALTELVTQKYMTEFDLKSQITRTEQELCAEKSSNKEVNEKCETLRQRIQQCEQENRALKSELQNRQEKEDSLLHKADKEKDCIQAFFVFCSFYIVAIAISMLLCCVLWS